MGKTAKRVMLCKPNKVAYTVVKSYQVISCCKCLGKVCEKVGAEILADWWEIHHILYEGQIKSRRQKSAIEAVARVSHRVQGAPVGGKLAGLFLMYDRGAFDNVSKNCLMRNIEALGADGHLVRWTELFLSDRSVSLVVDNYQLVAAEVEIGVPQGSPVSSILCAIYLSPIFK